MSILSVKWVAPTPIDPIDPIFQVATVGEHCFPGIWRYMLPEDFSWLRFPRERLTTCDDCYEVAVGNYHPNCRCCTHFHNMPNFMVGLALTDPRSRSIIEPIIESRQALPQGLLPTPSQFVASVEAYSRDMFGRSPELNCVFMDPVTFRCRVYALRNSICSTFFCQTDHGKAGDGFWEEVQTFAGQVEIALEHWCMDEMGLGATEYAERLNGLAGQIDALSDPSTGMWTVDACKSLWADWFGREVEFFQGCAKLVMDRRDELYEIARRQPLFRPLAYERMERLAVPKKHRHEAPPIPSDEDEVVSIDDLWYKLQLVHRRLWELPFNDGAVVLGPDVTIETKTNEHSTLPVFADKTHVATRRSEDRITDTFYLTREEEAALKSLEQSQVIGEELFERPEIVALEDPREFLAKCMRRGFLVPCLSLDG
ncbi:MAG: hypothetical protein GY847_33635 [Proteobacteria bacterium]|nr:hypothetical protein [Pseudomonadota bacterium]